MSSTSNESKEIANLSGHFKAMIDTAPSLPQNVDEAHRLIRKLEVKHYQHHYQYKYNSNVGQAPILKPDPFTHFLHIDENPKPKYLQLVVGKLLEIFGTVKEEAFEKILRARWDPTELKELFEMIVPKTFDLRPNDITSYNEVFGSDLKNLPTVTKDYQMDAAFARWRLAGPNPVMIEPCTPKMLDEKANLDTLDKTKKDAIIKASEESRLFMCDYTPLMTMKPGACGGHEKISVGPLALFEVPLDNDKKDREWLQPVAIQCNFYDPKGKPTNTKQPIYTPEDKIKWTIAKLMCNSADADIHEAIYHLAYTHLTVEPFVIGTRRALPSNHPIFVLLKPHFEGTAFINFLAEQTLMNPGGHVDILANQEIHELERYVGDQVVKYLGADFTFPANIQRRNMGSDRFPGTYPYRDDGVLIWDAIYAWVDGYLRYYYGPDDQTCKKNIVEDDELQNWVNELKQNGRVGWLNSFDDSIKMLVDVVAAVIFTASAQHAALNFPQDQVMSYSPAFSLGVYQKPPSAADTTTEQNYLDTLPPMESAYAQRKVGQLLGGVHYTTLGQYDYGYFVDGNVNKLLEKFQMALGEAQRTIQERNKTRVSNWNGKVPGDVAQNWSYDYLLPTGIPQSINI